MTDIASMLVHLDTASLDFSGRPGSTLLLAGNRQQEAGPSTLGYLVWTLLPPLSSAPRIGQAKNGHSRDELGGVISMIDVARVRYLRDRGAVDVDSAAFAPTSSSTASSRGWSSPVSIGSSLSLESYSGSTDAVGETERRASALRRRQGISTR